MNGKAKGGGGGVTGETIRFIDGCLPKEMVETAGRFFESVCCVFIGEGVPANAIAAFSMPFLSPFGKSSSPGYLFLARS